MVSCLLNWGQAISRETTFPKYLKFMVSGKRERFVREKKKYITSSLSVLQVSQILILLKKSDSITAVLSAVTISCYESSFTLCVRFL